MRDFGLDLAFVLSGASGAIGKAHAGRSTASLSCTITWTGADDDDPTAWDKEKNWSDKKGSARRPNAGDTACFPEATTVTINGDGVVGSISAPAGLTLDRGTLTLFGPYLRGDGAATLVRAAARLVLRGRSVQHVGDGHTVRNEGTLEWRRGSVWLRPRSRIENIGVFDARAGGSRMVQNGLGTAPTFHTRVASLARRPILPAPSTSPSRSTTTARSNEAGVQGRRGAQEWLRVTLDAARRMVANEGGVAEGRVAGPRAPVGH